jgi:hypothetical protein
MNKQEQEIWKSGYFAGFSEGLKQSCFPLENKEITSGPWSKDSYSRELDEQDVYRKYYPWGGGKSLDTR